MIKLFLFFLLNFNLYSDTIFSVASYNVENLFDLQKNGYEYYEYIPNNSANWNKQTYKIKLNNIQKVIKAIDADIIALEEIESKKALSDLREILPQYKYMAIANKKTTNIKTALLSKFPIIATKEVFVGGRSYKYRNILEVTFDIYNKPLTVFVNHWKAKSGPESERLIYAKALKKRLQKMRNSEYILLGDFNANYNEFQTFLKKRRLNDTNGKTGINHILKTIKNNQFIYLDTLRANYHYNLWLDLPKKERYSHFYKGVKGTLDNILIPKSLYNQQNIEYIKNSFTVYKPSYLIKGKRIQRWKMRKRKHIGKGYSDHLPIIANFKVKN
jgi:exonuclease III